MDNETQKAKASVDFWTKAKAIGYAGPPAPKPEPEQEVPESPTPEQMDAWSVDEYRANREALGVKDSSLFGEHRPEITRRPSAYAYGQRNRSVGDKPGQNERN